MQRATRRSAGKAVKSWWVRLLGEPALVAPDGAAHALEPRAAALFALAALEPGLSRRRVAALLWPDSEESKARQALRQQLLRLKKLAGAELLEGDSTLRLAGRIRTDLDGEETGRFLGGFDYEAGSELAQWVERHRSARSDSATRRLEQRLRDAEAAGDREACAAISEQLIAADPANERHHHTAMRLHYLAGDLARARAAYERLRAMLEREFAASPSAETEQLARTIRAAGAAPATVSSSRAPPPSVLRPPRMIGRDREWEALEEGWRASHAVIVVGVAGMGKTRLVSDFAAGRGRAVVVTARPGDALAAYSLLARLVRRLAPQDRDRWSPGLRKELAHLLPELGEAEPVRGRAGHARLLRAVEAVIDAAIAEGLAGIVLDDLHYADAATLEALLATVAGDRRIPLILACRSDEADAARALFDALAAPGVGRTIELVPLTAPQVAELIESLDLPGMRGADVAVAVTHHTGGNPLFVLETVKLMLQEGAARNANLPLPAADSMTALIERRIGRLSAEAVRIARCAAIAGQDFSAELAARVLGVRALDLADGWNELEAAHVLHDGAFAHDLVYEAALASVPAPIAERLHAEIAEFLEAAGTEPGRVAGHWRAARRHREAGAAFQRAAIRARAAGRHYEHALLLERAAESLRLGGDPDACFEALLERAYTMIYVELGEGTQEAVAQAGEAARNQDQRLRALHAKAEFLDNRGDAESAVRTAREGIELARSAGRMDLVVRFSVVAGGALGELRRVDEALALMEPLRAWAAANLDPQARADYLLYLGIVLDLANRLSEAIEAFEEARALAAQAGHPDLLALALSNLATTNSKCGRITRAADYGRNALQVWRESDSLRGTPLQTQALLAHRLRDLGHYDEAIAMFEEALAEFRRVGSVWRYSTAHRLALAYSYVGQHARAIRLLAEEPEGIPTKARAMWIAHRAEAARLSGGDGLPSLRAGQQLLGNDVDDGNNRVVGLFATAIVPPEEGEAIATSTAAWAAARERNGMAIAAHVRAAACALALGAVERALPQVEAAVRLFGNYEPDNFYRGEIWWVASRVFAAAERPTRADRMLAEGRAWIRKTAAEHVRAEFRDSFLNRNPVNRALLSAAVRLPEA